MSWLYWASEDVSKNMRVHLAVAEPCAADLARTIHLIDHRAKVAAWREEGFAFGIGLVLRGLQDPPVVIPVGSVYQQPVMGSAMQNLAVGQAARVFVAAGATVPLILPAWCLNRSLAPPSGPVAPTVLIAMSARGSQSEMWSRIEVRHRGDA